MFAQASEALCRAVCSNDVDAHVITSLSKLLTNRCCLRVALAGILAGHVSLTSDLFTPGPVTAALHPTQHSCTGAVITSCSPYLASDTERLHSDFQDLTAITFEVLSGDVFFCVPLTRPDGGDDASPAAFGALLAQFPSAAHVTPADLKACLLLANELSQNHSKVLLAFASNVAAALSPPGHGAGWGLVPGGSVSGSSGSEVSEGEGQLSEARCAAASRLLAGMGRPTLRFGQQRDEAAYAVWRHRQLVQSDGLRLAGLACCHLLVMFVAYPHLTGAASAVPLALLALPLALRAAPATRGWYAAWRDSLLASLLLTLVVHGALRLPALLHALPDVAWRWRIVKVGCLWMMGTGVALQVRFPWHAALLLSASAAWMLAGPCVCPLLHPSERPSVCVVVGCFKVVCCQLLLPCVAVYFTELGERRLWATSVWQGHLHQE